jgi:hypothetical protein
MSNCALDSDFFPYVMWRSVSAEGKTEGISIIRINQAFTTGDLEISRRQLIPEASLLPLIYQALCGDDTFLDAQILFRPPQETGHSLPAELLTPPLCRVSCSPPGTPVRFLLDQTPVQGHAGLRSLIRKNLKNNCLFFQYPEGGQTASWAANLYQYLGFLSATPSISRAVQLLQTLRTTGRSLPFMADTAASACRHELRTTLQQWLTDHSIRAALPESLFTQYPEKSFPTERPLQQILEMAATCTREWRNATDHPRHALYDQLDALSRILLPKVGDTMSLPTFIPACLPLFSAHLPNPKPTRLRPYQGDIQIVMVARPGVQELALHKIVPGIHTGFTPFLHLFPSDFREKLQERLNNQNAVLFPFTPLGNDYFCPLSTRPNLWIPDGRQAFNLASRVPEELFVVQTTTGPRLADRHTGRPVEVLPPNPVNFSTLPAAYQLLWQLCVPEWEQDPDKENHANKNTSTDLWPDGREEYTIGVYSTEEQARRP